MLCWPLTIFGVQIFICLLCLCNIHLTQDFIYVSRRSFIKELIVSGISNPRKMNKRGHTERTSYNWEDEQVILYSHSDSESSSLTVIFIDPIHWFNILQPKTEYWISSKHDHLALNNIHVKISSFLSTPAQSVAELDHQAIRNAILSFLKGILIQVFAQDVWDQLVLLC